MPTPPRESAVPFVHSEVLYLPIYSLLSVYSLLFCRFSGCDFAVQLVQSCCDLEALKAFKVGALD